MNEIEQNLNELVWNAVEQNQISFDRCIERISLALSEVELLSSDLNQLHREKQVGETNWIVLGNRMIAPYLIHEVRVRPPTLEQDIADSRNLWEIVVGDEVFLVALNQEEGRGLLNAIGGQGELDLTEFFEADPDTAENDKSDFSLRKLKILHRVDVPAQPGSSNAVELEDRTGEDCILNGIRLLDLLERMGFTASYSQSAKNRIIRRYLDGTVEESQNIEDFARFVETNYYVPCLQNIRKRSGMRI